MKEQKDFNNQIKELSLKALKGNLQLEQLWSEWPEEANKTDFLKQIFDDIEDAVEHLPASTFRDKILFKEWRESDIYLLLLLDYILLSLNQDFDNLFRCRKILIKQKDINRKNVRDRIKEFFI